MNNINFQIWETIEIGTYKSIKEFEKAINENCLIKNFSKNLLKSPSFILSKEHKKINLVVVTPYIVYPKKLDFEFYVTYERICRIAFKNGLKLCPVETGLQICLQSNRLCKGTSLNIVTESIFIPTIKKSCISHIDRWYDDGNIVITGLSIFSEKNFNRFSKFIFCT
ncbi:MAG: hypothetical protein HXX18_12025 [Bacteroidetes bacterium]|nr:hypothetical protein [Bacteroidota bacterium]